MISDIFQKAALSAYAGQSAFFMMLSFFPFLLFFFSVLNLTPLSQEDFTIWLLTVVPEAFEDFVKGFTQEIYKGSTGRISITMLFAIFLSSKAFLSLQQGMNAVYEVKEQRNYILLRIYGMIYSLILALILVFMLALMVFGNWIHMHFLAKIPFPLTIFLIIIYPLFRYFRLYFSYDLTHSFSAMRKMSQNVRWTFVLRRPKRSGELDLGARTASVLH